MNWIPDDRDGLPDADGGECGSPVPGEGGLHLADVVGVALPLELGRDALWQYLVVLTCLGIYSTGFSLHYCLVIHVAGLVSSCRVMILMNLRL